MCSFPNPHPSSNSPPSFEPPHSFEHPQMEMDEYHDVPTCSVCICCFEEGEDLRRLPCMHIFHQACIDPWMTRNDTCPNCRRSLNPEAAGNRGRRNRRRHRNNTPAAPIAGPGLQPPGLPPQTLDPQSLPELSPGQLQLLQLVQAPPAGPNGSTLWPLGPEPALPPPNPDHGASGSEAQAPGPGPAAAGEVEMREFRPELSGDLEPLQQPSPRYLAGPQVLLPAPVSASSNPPAQPASPRP